MIKVFLVEDEFVVREGIKNNIDWAGEGFKFCGEAADGELAYPLIKQQQPDIIITDIRIPFMNGLELSRLVKKELPQCKIIILSGHEEFVYAQEAIKIGVAEYLLKPINSTELIKIVKRVAEQVMLEREEKQNFERYKKEMEENETDIKRRLFNEIISGSLAIANILEKGKELGIELSAQNYQIMLFKYGTANGCEATAAEQLNLCCEINRLNQSFDDIVVFDRSIEGSALLFKGSTAEQINELRGSYINKLKALLNKYTKITYFGGIGNTVGRLTKLSDSYENAARAFSHRFISDKSDIISFDELCTLQNCKQADVPLCADEISSLDRKKIENFLKNGQAEEIRFFAEDFLKSIGSASEKSFLFRQYVLMDIYFTVIAFLKEVGVANALTELPLVGSGQMNKLTGDSQMAKDYIIAIFTAAIHHRDEISKKSYLRIIEQAKEYISEHYSDDELSLNEVSAYVNLSASHFSAVFSRATGQSFIKYLSDLRMCKAKELLKCSDMRCADIGVAVGYKDPHYFSYLFKKTQNCSPMQYRA